MKISEKKKIYREFIKKQKLKEIKNVDLSIFEKTDKNEKEEEEKYIYGGLFRDQEKNIKIMLFIDTEIPEEKIREEITYIREVYGVKEVETKEDYLDFVFYHEWGHVLQYDKLFGECESSEEVEKRDKASHMQRNKIMELLEENKITEIEADKLYRKLPYEEDADSYAINQLRKRKQ